VRTDLDGPIRGKIDDFFIENGLSHPWNSSFPTVMGISRWMSQGGKGLVKQE
jgi:hypothetical protein